MAIAFLFFFSGVLALVYEALWQRRFALVFGSAATATAAVLASYFAGLAVGAWTIGNRVARFSSPLKVYALLECGIAVGAAMVEVLLRLFDLIAPPISGAALLVLKTAVAFATLALPTLCMGGTLPALGALVDRGQHRLGRTAGLLYVVNTAGAALGVTAVPLVLLPFLGARASLLICVAGNLGIAALAYRIAARAERATANHSAGTVAQNRADRSPGPLNFSLAFLSGLTAFVAQVLWNRAFAQVHENSLYSFALIVAVFIAALAIGGQITRLTLHRRFQPESLISFGWIGAGFLLIACPFIFVNLTKGLGYIIAPDGWWHYAARLIGLALVVVLPVATLMGMALPAIFERAGRASDNPGQTLGHLLTANLIGSAAGAVLAGFMLPPTLGLWGSMIFCGAILWAAAANFLPKFKVAFLLIALPLLVGIAVRNGLPRVRLAADRGEKLVSLTEGAHGIVAVTERGNSRRMKLNNAYVLGGTASTGDERMQSHLPLLLHANPKRVAYMGLGTGISAGGALFHPVEQITVLELVPEVAVAARVAFGDANMHLLEQPQTRLIVEDARNYLRHTREKFDVIIGDLVVPWRAGEGALFTIENFRAGRNALNNGGIFCQWLPMFQLSEDEFQILLNTFLAVFPEAYIWRGDFSPDQPALALLGFAEGATLDGETVRARLKQMRADPANPHLIEDFAVWMNFVGVVEREDVNLKWKINSEDRPWVELVGPLTHAGRGETFVGRPLQEWMREMKGVSMARFHAGERAAAAMFAGDALFEFTINLSENNQTAAVESRRKVEELASPALYQILFPSGK